MMNNYNNNVLKNMFPEQAIANTHTHGYFSLVFKMSSSYLLFIEILVPCTRNN